MSKSKFIDWKDNQVIEDKHYRPLAPIYRVQVKQLFKLLPKGVEYGEFSDFIRAFDIILQYAFTGVFIKDDSISEDAQDVVNCFIPTIQSSRTHANNSKKGKNNTDDERV